METIKHLTELDESGKHQWAISVENGLVRIVCGETTICWMDFWITPECQKQKQFDDILKSANEICDAHNTTIEQ